MKHKEAMNEQPKPYTTLETNLRCSMVIALCFLWTACGYLSWMYHLMRFAQPSSVDWLTEVIGYLFQAAGILLFGFIIKRNKAVFSDKFVFIGCIAADFFCMVLAVLSPNLAAVLLWGYLMNFAHGVIAGFYLTQLATQVEHQYRCVVFGGAYAASSIASWLISLPQQSNFLGSPYALIIYALLVFITIGIILTGKQPLPCEKLSFTEEKLSFGTIALAGSTVVLLSLTRGIGFFFPVADISSGISLEFSRAFYAVGLVIAGIVGSLSRRYGAISCLAALFFPFAMIALSDEVGISIALWILGYLFFGFLSVFRVVLFADIARTKECFVYVAAFGLMFGRIGDAAGNLTGILLNHKIVPLVIISGVCFVATFILFFMLYNKLYMPAAEPLPSREEHLNEFIQKHEISIREVEVLNLIIEGASNGEIAAKLFISENTVKFHVRNILKKTGCSNRTELIAAINHP